MSNMPLLQTEDGDTITRLQGEAKVLRDLLSQALTVLETIDPDGDSADGLETLIDHIEAALKVKPCP